MGTAYEVVCDDRDRRRWLTARREGIGGSEAAAILGVNPYSSAMEVYAEKLGLGRQITDNDEPPSEYARWGKILEPHLFADFERSTGRSVKREGRLLRSRQRPWQLSTLDARQRRSGVRSPGLLECKTTKFEWDGEIPDDVVCQVQHQFAVTGWEWGSVYVWNRMTCEGQPFDVEPDKNYIEEMTELEAKFWEDLVNGVAPDPDETSGTARALKLIYPKSIEGKLVDLDGSMLDLTDDLEVMKDEMNQLRKKREGLENLLKAAIGDAEAGVLPNGVAYTHKLQHRKETIQKASSFRVLRRKEAKHGI